MANHTIFGKHPSYPNHLISIDGAIYRKGFYDTNSRWRPSKFLSISYHKAGYSQVNLNYQPRKTANLVAETFLMYTKTPIKCKVLHRNDVKTDSSIENLYYGSHEDNLADAVRNGNRVYKVHENCHKAKHKRLIVTTGKTEQLFNSIKEACEFMGCCASSVSQALKNGNKIKRIYNVTIQVQ